MRYQQVLALSALVMAMLGACRKESANDAPSIRITAPAENASFSLPDTIMVTVEAIDGQGLAQVSVTLLNQHDMPVVNAVGTAVAGTSANITLALPVVSEQLESGVYKLFATASDGELNGKDASPVHITAVPLRVQTIFTVVEASSNSVALYKTDSTGPTALVAAWPMDLCGAAISSTAQRLYIAGSSSGDLRAFSTGGLGLVWQQPNLSQVGAPWFTSVDLCADGNLYAGEDDGTLRGFNAANGSGLFTATLPEQFRSEQAISMGDLVICTAKHFVTQEQRLAMFYRASGVLQQAQPLDLTPVRIFARDHEHVLLFGNRNGHGVVQDRNVPGGGAWEPYTWPSPITAVEQVDAGTWLVALGSGSLQRFTLNNAGSMGIATTPVLNTMTLDRANGSVYGGANSQVLAIDPFTGNVVPAWSANGNVRFVLPVLNR